MDQTGTLKHEKKKRKEKLDCFKVTAIALVITHFRVPYVNISSCECYIDKYLDIQNLERIFGVLMRGRESKSL